MADNIICPVCGETNPGDMEFCRNCQSRLHPLTGPLRGENSPIQPGDAPTKKVTSELEPILPQWLREARKNARDTAAEEAANAEPEEPSAPVPSGSDLLAGLASQSKDEEEDVPDWVAHITGAPAQKKRTVTEESQVKWVELGNSEEPADSSVLDEGKSPSSAQGGAPGKATEKDELAEWLKEATSSAETTDFRQKPSIPNAGQAAAAHQEGSAAPEPERMAGPEDLGWLRSLDAAAAEAKQSGEAVPPAREEAPDWLKKLQAEQQPVETPQPPARQPAAAEPEVPDWLRSFGDTAPATAAPEPAEQEQILPDVALPDWLTRMQGATQQAAPVPPEPGHEETMAPSELPSWMSSLGQPQEPAAEQGKPAEPVFHAEEPAAEEVQPAQPVFHTEEPAPEATPTTGPAFTEDSMSAHDVDAIFASMQTPDWLSAVAPSQPPAAENVPAAAQKEESIGPAELPSWVQAMRPVESAIAAPASGPATAGMEEVGPLAGLNGVLPTIPGAAAPSSKPKAHSIKLDATEQQRAHAALLEQILAAETAPVPMRSSGVLQSQKVLRWAISALLLVVLGSAVFTGSRIFPLPGAVPNETIAAVQAVEAVPADAPVLLVFDYQPSTVGEMEATAASLLDHMLLLKHPHLALLSTSPTGAALAERFMSTTLAARTYARNTQYVDLGYLPGGLAGVYDFAQNPSATMPLGADAQPVWQSPVLSSVTRFSDFAAIIVLTDSLEAGRTWIEQSAPSRGSSLMVIAASAQAGPLLLPYADAGQVNGLISGVSGAAGAEQANGGLPGYVRRYWDAYSLGLYLAILLIVAGGLWNFWQGVRDRRAQEAG